MSEQDKYKLEEQELNRRRQAARILGLTIEGDYKIEDGDFFLMFKLKKGEIILKTYTLERDKKQVLTELEQTISGLQVQIDSLQTEIDKIIALE